VLVLVVNAGSSSLKLSVLDDANRAILEQKLDLPDGADPVPGMQEFLKEAPTPDVAGHRVVHGGAEFRAPVVIDEEVFQRLQGLRGLAPLHNPPALAGVAALRRVAPELTAVACFDTTFHATIPEAAARYAVPADWHVRRYGFHGLSHAWASRRAAELLGRTVTSLRVVTCHLGAGASLCAVDGGASVDTTMGYTPLEGLVMATRSGSIDPGAVLAVQRRLGLSSQEVERTLNHQSGLLALAGTGDMREILDRIGEGDRQARLALDVYLHRLRTSIAAMVAAMGGTDAVVFTGGVGEKAPRVREDAVVGLGFLGLAIDGEANLRGSGDRDISAPGSTVRTLVIHAREDVVIAEAARRLTGSGLG
jgi:acetate kinase